MQDCCEALFLNVHFYPASERERILMLSFLMSRAAFVQMSALIHAAWA